MMRRRGWTAGVFASAIVGLFDLFGRDARAARQLSTKLLEPIELAPVIARAEEKAAAYGGGRWLVAYTDPSQRMAAAWVADDGEPIEKSFALFGTTPARHPYLVYDGESFVLLWFEAWNDLFYLTRIGEREIGPSVRVQPDLPESHFGTDTIARLQVDDAGVVHVVSCATQAGSTNCSIGTFSNDRLEPRLSFALPYVPAGLELEVTNDGFLLFVETVSDGVFAYHVADDGTLSVPVVLSARQDPDYDRFQQTVTAARSGDSYAVVWANPTGPRLLAARLDAAGQLLWSGSIPWTVNTLTPAQLAPLDAGFALLAQGGETECYTACASVALLQAFTPELVPLSAEPRQVAPCSRDHLALASDGERVLGGWGSADHTSYQAAVFDTTSDSAAPAPVDLSFEQVVQGRVVAAPSDEGWLATWEAAIDGGTGLRARRLDPRGVAEDAPFSLVQGQPGLSLGSASRGPTGTLVTWSVDGALSATFVPEGSTAGTTRALSESAHHVLVRAKAGDGWLVVGTRAGAPGLWTERLSAEGSPVASRQLTSSTENVDSIAVDANAAGYLALWSSYFSYTYRLGDFTLQGSDYQLLTLQLDSAGEPLEEAKVLQTWQDGMQDPRSEPMFNLKLAVTGDVERVAWSANWGPNLGACSSELPLSETVQTLGESSIELRSAGRSFLAAGDTYGDSYVAVAEPGGEFVRQPSPSISLHAVSEARDTPSSGRTSTATLLITGTLDNRLFGGVPGSAGVVLVDVTDTAGAGGEAAGGSGGTSNASAEGGADTSPAGDSSSGGDGTTSPPLNEGGAGASESEEPGGASSSEPSPVASAKASGGCGCRMAPQPAATRLGALALAGLALLRKRRGSRSRRG